MAEAAARSSVGPFRGCGMAACSAKMHRKTNLGQLPLKAPDGLGELFWGTRAGRPNWTCWSKPRPGQGRSPKTDLAPPQALTLLAFPGSRPAYPHPKKANLASSFPCTGPEPPRPLTSARWRPSGASWKAFPGGTQNDRNLSAPALAEKGADPKRRPESRFGVTL